MKPIFATKSLDPNHKAKVVGCDGYRVPSSEAVEGMNVAEIKANFALANSLLLTWIQAYLDLRESVRNQASLDDLKYLKLQRRHRPFCEHEWTPWYGHGGGTHSARNCPVCGARETRVGGSYWTGD